MNKIITILLLAVFLSVLSGCSGDNHDHVGIFDETFERAYSDYRQMPAYKALALARDSEGNWAYGYTRNQSNQAEANSQAMIECKKRVATFNVNEECRIYAEDNIIIY